MSNFADFWGSTKEKLKNKKKLFSTPKLKLPAKFFEILKIVKNFLREFWKRLLRLPKVLSRKDKLALLVILIVLLGLCGYKFQRDYLSKTKRVPTVGGQYKEAIIGEARYLNPILAKSDTDRTINKMIYSGLTKIDKNGSIVPDLAKNWEISSDGKTYNFTLKSGVFWHDGAELTSQDIVATIEAIKNQNIKSPYYDAWKDVEVEAPNKDSVIFKLNDPYGPFIYNTLVGIIPAHLDASLISSAPVGTGPYKFTKVVSGKDEKIKEVVLKRNDNYFDQRPYIEEVIFEIAEDENAAKKLFDTRSVTAIAGVKVEKNDVNNYSFSTSRYFGLVFNVRDEKFKDINLRKKIKAKENFESEFEFKITVLDKPLCVAQAEAIRNDYEKLNVKIDVEKKSAIDFQSIIEKRNFQAILYGFDSEYDRDPYEFWHSSQVTSGMNFSGFSEKDADILLEDARMTIDAGVRNQKYDQLFTILDDKALVIFYPNQDYRISIKNSIKGIESLKGSEPYDHLNSLADWYIKTKRIKP